MKFHTTPGGTALLLTALALTAGCGKSEAPAPQTRPAGTANTKSATTAPDASAEEVARQARGDLRCPPKLQTPARPEGAPVDDIVGVRPGLRYEEAAALVACSNDLLVVTPASGRGFDIKTYGQTLRQGFDARFAEPRVAKTGRQILQDMQAEATARGMNAVRQDPKEGQTRWFVSTLGAPGEERVLSAARAERYALDRSPALTTTMDALVAKYGTPTQALSLGGGSTSVRWAFDPQGQRITERSPLYATCHAAADPDSPVHVSTACGLVIQAELQAQRTNPGLVAKLMVGVVDQANAYRLIRATEQTLAELDAQRRAQEVQKAEKNGKSPTL